MRVFHLEPPFNFSSLYFKSSSLPEFFDRTKSLRVMGSFLIFYMFCRCLSQRTLAITGEIFLIKKFCSMNYRDNFD